MKGDNVLPVIPGQHPVLPILGSVPGMILSWGNRFIIERMFGFQKQSYSDAFRQWIFSFYSFIFSIIKGCWFSIHLSHIQVLQDVWLIPGALAHQQACALYLWRVSLQLAWDQSVPSCYTEDFPITMEAPNTETVSSDQTWFLVSRMYLYRQDWILISISLLLMRREVTRQLNDLLSIMSRLRFFQELTHACGL